ncbi:class I SAM-dependent methyltransferase [Cohnella lupini]|uniref:SAM-dependent MidA family methyltransferase n=1 Tax=Cohnella lupini TaxID=1294267 RepID=A0A3D9IVL6_9BACL|nr:SAM-dependent methyltransferase [Cohnella lupini]RED65762.1 SAM-dependent MidA family methyltransferase [Cohnella lupini]
MDSVKTAFAQTPLFAIIEDSIRNSILAGRLENGSKLSAISFYHYMTLCLYHPEFGYYRSGSSKVGRNGDFYTSAYVGELMGDQLASELSRLAEQWFPGEESVNVLDWGGGTGRLGRQMMDSWNGIGDDGPGPERGLKGFTLTVVEGNPEHRRLAFEELEPYIEAGKARVLDNETGVNIPMGEQPTIIVANELLDAFPVHRLVWRDGKLQEWGVALNEAGGGFVRCLMEPTNPRLPEWVRDEQIALLDNQTFEVNLDAADWVADLSERLERAILVIIDYGDETEELIAPHRMDGTMLCYRQHRAHNDPFEAPGEQDLTSHVNFSHIRRIAAIHGWTERWYGSQKKFLVDSGILQKLSAHAITDPFHPMVRRNRAIRQLLLSDGMSELFKVQILVRT